MFEVTGASKEWRIRSVVPRKSFQGINRALGGGIMEIGVLWKSSALLRKCIGLPFPNPIMRKSPAGLDVHAESRKSSRVVGGFHI